MNRILLVLAIIAFMLTPGHLFAKTPELPGEVIVKLSLSKGKGKSILKGFRKKFERKLFVLETPGIYALLGVSPGKAEIEEVIIPSGRSICNQVKENIRSEIRTKAEKQRRNLVRRVRCSSNGIVTTSQATVTPADPSYSTLWGLNSSLDYDINAPQAWTKTTGSRSVIVAVTDTGINYNHPDLVGNLWTNHGEIPGNGVDDDGNGFVDDIHGYNFVSNNANANDDHSHGSHCAGTIGAVGNNGVGITGVNWQVSMIAVKILNSSGSGSWAGIIAGLSYINTLKDSGTNISVVNASWGGVGTSSPIATEISRMRDRGILFVAAAGNNNSNNETTFVTPASYTLSNIISVAASDVNGGKASFSNYSTARVHLAAPGVSINSTVLGSGYSYFNGTSMAAPHVAGAAALIKSYSSELTATQLKDAILNNTRTVAGWSPFVSTSGILDVNKAISSVSGVPLPTPTPVPTATFTPTPLPTLTPTPVPTATATMTPTSTPTPIPEAPGDYGITLSLKSSAGAPVGQVEVKLVAGSSTIVRYSGSDGLVAFPAVAGPVDFELEFKHVSYAFSKQSGRLNKNISLNLTAVSQNYSLCIFTVSPTKVPVSGALIKLENIAQALSDNAGKSCFSLPYGTKYKTVATKSDHHAIHLPEGMLRGNTERVVVLKASE